MGTGLFLFGIKRMRHTRFLKYKVVCKKHYSADQKVKKVQYWVFETYEIFFSVYVFKFY